MVGYIYLIRNKINDKLYVGQTIGSIRQRWAVHSNPKNKNIISKAVQKYGKHNFEISAVETISADNKEMLFDKLNMLEKSYIQAWNCIAPFGYNILLGGKNSSRPASVCAKISKSLKGRDSQKTQLGKKFSQEHKDRMSRSSKWSKPVICIENQQIYSSVTNAAKSLNIPRTSLSQSLRKTGIYEGSVTVKYARNQNAKA